MRRGRPPYPDTLTPREQEVLALLREGLTNEQIAERLGISFAGAKYHVSEILSKLYVSSREEAALWRPRERVFGLAFLGALFKKLRPGGIMHLTAKAVLVASLSIVALIAIGVGVMALRNNDDASPKSTTALSAPSPAPTQASAQVAATTTPSATTATAVPLPLPSFDAFREVKNYKAHLVFEASRLTVDPSSGEEVCKSPEGTVLDRKWCANPADITLEFEGTNFHAYLNDKELGPIELIKIGKDYYTKAEGTWTAGALPDLNISAMNSANVAQEIQESVPAKNTGEKDNVDGVECEIVDARSGPAKGPGESVQENFSICWADGYPLLYVKDLSYMARPSGKTTVYLSDFKRRLWHHCAAPIVGCRE
jgi:DNA-binding CsgD family transcriptional regulator